MTCIAACLHPRGALVCADTCLSLPNMRARDSNKLALRGKVIIGAAGDGRLCELALTVPCKPYRSGDLGNWLRMTLVPSIWGVADAKATDDLSVMVLAVTAREIAIVDGGGAIVLPLDASFAAIGSGAEYAIGHLSATSGADLPVRERLEAAMTVAAQYAPGVHPPWTWEEARR